MERAMAAMALVAGLVGGARAQYFCSGLPDQDTPHVFKTPLYGEDTRTVYQGSIAYSCNHSSGGVTYLQNMSYIFDYSGGENATLDTSGDVFRLDMNFSMAANGCRSALGVNINYTIMVQYPDKVWDSLLKIDSLWPTQKPDIPLIGQVQTVSNSTTLDESTTVFSAATLICKDYAKGDAATCGPVNQNISNMLIQTGTNVELEIKTVEGSSQGPDGGTKDPPGLAFQMDSTISFLSSESSGLCKGMKPFCCAEPTEEAGCCCTPHEMKAQCKTGMAPFISKSCSAATGQGDVCSDHMDDPSKPDNGDKTKAQKSACETFKKGVYNFTIANQKGAGLQGRVNVFPDDGGAPTYLSSLESMHPSLYAQLHPRRVLTEEDEGVRSVATLAGDEGVSGDAVMLGTSSGAGKGTVSFDLLQYVFAELCSTTLGNRKDTRDCPGCEKGACWLSGDQKGADGKGYVKIGNFATCDSITNKILRAVGVWGLVGLILLIIALVGAGGFFAFQMYKKKNAGQMDFGISDSIYKDVGSSSAVSDAADVALAGSDSESVVR